MMLRSTRPTRQVPSLVAIWSILWRATLSLSAIAVAFILVCFGFLWQAGLSLVAYLLIVFLFARAASHEAPSSDTAEDQIAFL
jgi:hypothetical protein